MELYVCKFEYPWDLGYYKLGLVNFLKVIYTLSIKNILKRRNQNFQILDSIHS